jgi:hypothetical protein
MRRLRAMKKLPNLLEYRYYNTDELDMFPVGTIFNHKTKGRCWIGVGPEQIGFMLAHNAKFLIFDSGEKYCLATKKKLLATQVIVSPMCVLSCSIETRKLNLEYDTPTKDQLLETIFDED